MFVSLADSQFIEALEDGAARDASGAGATPVLTAEAGGGTVSLIPKELSLLVISDGIRGNASTAAFVARGFRAHFGGASGQVSFAHMPNASLDEVADRIEERQQ